MRSPYRNHTLSSFLLTLGTTTAIVGGLSDRWLLFSLGLSLASLGLLWRWQIHWDVEPRNEEDKKSEFHNN